MKSFRYACSVWRIDCVLEVLCVSPMKITCSLTNNNKRGGEVVVKWLCFVRAQNTIVNTVISFFPSVRTILRQTYGRRLPLSLALLSCRGSSFRPSRWHRFRCCILCAVKIRLDQLL
ncbi:unnamed protein product [Chondrus crispus]|uniref:Uncharacterized protein n=1 Tax=Chondrus crispus TaxID=2769 RepID=R7QHV2_CHOCR|nr:unnamed protein product [Chondrus crispus]CDF36975.1 unnamed protein product [Chondrus crispus]|eukprot:XP_005716794.1 unnamed protein product [Chondrus crispus]